MKKVRSLFIVAAVVAGAMLLGAAPATAGGGGCHMTTFTDESGTKVNLTDACFAPTVLRVQPGQKVTWTNQDGMTHTVTGALGGWGDYDELSPGKSVSYRFQAAGVFPYFCALHPGMVAAVVVGDGGSATSTQAAAPVFVPETQVPAPPVAGAAQVQPAATSTDTVWRTVALVAFGLLVLAGGVFAAQQVAVRRSRVEVKAG